MKKILIIGVILGMTLPLTAFAQEEGINIGPVKFQLGLNQFPGKNYWAEFMAKWEAPTWKYKVAQEEEAFHVSLLSFRASTMKPVLSPDFSAGLEVGCEMPISSWEKEWKNAAGDIEAVPPTLTEYTVIEWEPIFHLEAPDEDYGEDYKQSLQMKEKLLVVPILGKLAYTGGERIKVGAALAFGAYVINARVTGTITHTYVQDSTDPENPFFEEGDEEVIEQTMSTTVCTPGGEFSVQLSLPVSPRVSVGLNGSLGYIAKTALDWYGEMTTYAPTDWAPPASLELTTFEQGFEVGGLSYGGGLSLNLFF